MSGDPGQGSPRRVETSGTDWARSPAGTGAPEWAVWSWTSGGRSRISWLGVFLVLVGVAILINQVTPGVTLTSLFLLEIGLAFAAAWIVGGWRGATVPALILLSLAFGRLVVEVGVAHDPGWTPLSLGVGLLLAWVIGTVQHVHRGWALWVGLVLALYGVAQVTTQLSGLPDLSWLWPAFLILAGVLLLLRRRVA